MFADEIKSIVPGISPTALEELENQYGNNLGFASGLDTVARILADMKLPTVVPVLCDPWKGIYHGIEARMNAGDSVPVAWASALSALPPALMLHINEAVTLRLSELNKMAWIQKGKKTKEDYLTALDQLGYHLKLNLAGNIIEVNGAAISDNVESDILLTMLDNGFQGRENIRDSIRVAAMAHAYHPIKDYLSGLHWDGVPRIAKLAGYFTYQCSIFPLLLQKWMIGSVARIFEGAQNPMLVLDGPQQIGKSYFAKWLCPMKAYHKEGPINPDDKDCRISAAHVWIWEVAELGSTTRRSDREALKNFLTTQTFTERASYGRNSQQYEAMASYIGTVNDEAGLLDDPTGSRRFWICQLSGMNRKYSVELDPADLWAEAYARYKAGEAYTLTEDEEKIMSEINEGYKVISSTEEAIKKYFHIDPNNKLWFTTFTEIRSVLKDPAKGDLSGSELDARKIAACLKGLGLASDKKRVVIGGNQQRGYYGIMPK